MFYLKNDDMEELFRKAAENYELDTNRASDWDSVHKTLHENNSNNPDENKKKKRRFIFWWFLLFPAGWMAHNTWDKIGRSSFRNQPVVLQQQMIKVASQTDDEINKSSGGTKLERDLTTAQQSSLNENDKETATAPIVKQALPVTADPSIDIDKLKSGTSRKDKTYNKTNPSVGSGAGGEAAVVHQSTGIPVYAAGQQGTEVNNTSAYTKRNKGYNNKAELNKGSVNDIPVGSLQVVDKSAMVLPEISVLKYIPAGQTGNKEAIASADSTAKKAVVKAAATKDRYFYAQVMVGPDLTSVKFQRIAGTGSSIGLLLGYRFNKRFQAEVAGYWEKKVYYSKGEYFDKSKLDYFRNHEIYNVDGNCHMITIPVNLRYNFISNRKSDWFITGGAAAYFMQKEYYDITYEYYGDTRTKGYTYKDASNNLLATVNVGIGYQTTLWKSFNFRVEPYFRMPVSGVGTGNLSLNSTGIYIGIGKRF